MFKRKTFIVVEGVLSENMEFKRLRAYEVERIRLEDRASDENSRVVVQLLDGNKQLITSKKLDVRFPHGCNPDTSLPGFGFIRAALLLHPDAKQFVLLAYDRIIFSETIGEQPPEIKNLKVELTCDKQIAVLQFDAEQIPADNIEVFVEESGGRRFPVIIDMQNNKYQIDLSLYAGRGEARVVVRATSDLRSSEAYSSYFKLPNATLLGRILTPINGDKWAAGDSCTITGNLFDNNARRIKWNDEEVFWFIDGKQLEDKNAIVLCNPLEPGEHTLELRHGQGVNSSTLLDCVHFSVRQETEAQKEYAAMLKEYLATKKDSVVQENTREATTKFNNEMDAGQIKAVTTR